MRYMLLLAVFVCGSALAVPPIQRYQLDSGTEVLFVRADALPIVDVRMIFHAGGARDGDLPGLAQLTHSLIDQGTPELDAGEIAERLESVGARLSGDSGRDGAAVHLRSLTEPEALDAAVDTLALVLGKASFPEPALARQRARMLVGLQAALQDPGTLAERAFYRVIYPNHPYGSPPDGTVEGLNAITRDDVVEFYRRYYAAGNAVIAIVGDVSEAKARSIAEELSAALPQGPAAPPLPEVAPLQSAPSEGVVFPSTQTHLTIGQPAIARDDPDYFPLYVGNHIFGQSGLVSILAEEMREKRGLSYSSGSYFVPSARKGPFAIETQVEAERADEALEVLRGLLRQFYEQGPTEEQLEAAKLNITGGFPLNLDSNSDIVGYVGMIGFYDLPADYLETFTQRVDAVTAADIRRAFQNHLDLEHMAVIRVGPKAKAQ